MNSLAVCTTNTGFGVPSSFLKAIFQAIENVSPVIQLYSGQPASVANEWPQFDECQVDGLAAYVHRYCFETGAALCYHSATVSDTAINLRLACCHWKHTSSLSLGRLHAQAAPAPEETDQSSDAFEATLCRDEGVESMWEISLKNLLKVVAQKSGRLDVTATSMLSPHASLAADAAEVGQTSVQAASTAEPDLHVLTESTDANVELRACRHCIHLTLDKNSRKVTIRFSGIHNHHPRTSCKVDVS